MHTRSKAGFKGIAILNVVAMTGVVSVLSGCASGGPVGGATGLKVVSVSQLPAPEIADLAASSRAYRVGPFDRLMVYVFGNKELSDREIQVDASGRFTFPLVGTIEAAGKTPVEIQQEMAGGLRGRYMRDPQVTINIKETKSQNVTIGGEVKEPGVYPFVGKTTLLTAIASAKGTSDVAKKSEVMVFRTVGGKDYLALYDIRAIQRGNYPDPEIYAGDTVMVGESTARQTWKYLLTASPILAPVLYLLTN